MQGPRVPSWKKVILLTSWDSQLSYIYYKITGSFLVQSKVLGGQFIGDLEKSYNIIEKTIRLGLSNDKSIIYFHSDISTTLNGLCDTMAG